LETGPGRAGNVAGSFSGGADPREGDPVIGTKDAARHDLELKSGGGGGDAFDEISTGGCFFHGMGRVWREIHGKGAGRCPTSMTRFHPPVPVAQNQVLYRVPPGDHANSKRPVPS